ncbi:hypothetical protein EDD17DRAFT_1770929 [Pisolithus thermaeus]|nr:hypothetical protein EDD17DRAFT_1770929 [Pisolithus thermaeus]
MDAEEDEEGEEEGEGEEEEEKEEDEQEEGGSIRRPQQAEPSGKRSYLQSIDSLCKWFGSNVGDSVVINHPPKRQIPTDVTCRHLGDSRAAASQRYQKQLNLFSAQFWREQDAVEIREGGSQGKKGALTNVDWHKQSAVVGCDNDAFECTLRELCRVFSLGDTLEIIAGPFCGETGYVVALHERTIVLVVMRPNQTSEDIEVSRFVVRSHLQDHVLSLGPVAEPHVVLPLSEDKALPGDVVQVHHGPYTGQTGIIEWISPDGKVWMFNRRKGKGKEDSEQDPTPSQSMVAMNASDLRIERAPGTLTLSKDKGYNIAVGDTVEVARGQWRHSQGVVKAVDLIKASLDFMRLEDGIQINVPITFSHKVKEHFDYGLSKFVGRDVWVIGSDKKGTQATLRSLGRTSSWVAIFGQLIELKNNQPSTPNPPLRTGMLLNGTLLPLQLQRSLKSLHNRSFITPVVPRNVTPPPSPGPSNAGPSDVWSITPDDIIQTQTPDYGEVPWLFQSEFCDFKSFHLGFNVSVGFTQVSLGKRVVRTVCPDRFVGQNGPAPSGSVCVMVTGHNAGSAIQHLTIPARYLMPANPTGKNQLCLVLKGSQAGRFSHFAGMLANPLRSDAPEGSPISGDAAVPTVQIFHTTTEVAQKRKFCEDQDSALGPPTKISHGTSLVFQVSSIGIQQIPHVLLVTSSLKRKNSEDHDLALGPPAKVPRTTSLISPRGHACLI